MPDYFSHFIAAEKIYERLPQDIKRRIPSRSLYILGAQGGDVFFAYSMKFSKTNPGRVLHNLNAGELFSELLKGNFCYAAGFATHYALDCTLHPAVYAYEATRRSPVAHQSFEADLGLYISKKFAIRRSILPRDKVLSCTSPMYDGIKGVLPQITVTGMERCLKRYFNYTRYIYRTKRQTYKCNYDFSNLSGAIDDSLSLGAELIRALHSKDLEGKFTKSFLER